ncbi:MAG: hypothetical protein KAR30_08185, partial [Gammaproteobacteria bacterium]|nr:hypothetical protein [Gammaproteobacteria bacterium]
IVGVNLTADEITADDGIIDQDLSTVEMSVFGDYAETMGGVHDITKTVEPEVCIVCEGNTVSYENARQVDVIAIDRIEPE